MNKFLYTGLLVLILAISIGSINVEAADGSFSVSLRYGMLNNSEVVKLQQFLIGRGYLQSSLATGNYLSSTRAAIKAFQGDNGIQSDGNNFGPLTRAAVNKVLAGNTGSGPKSTVSRVVVTGAPGTAAAIASSARTITWTTSNYPAGVGVNLNLLKKGTDANVSSYTLLQQIAYNTPNDGSEVWVPKAGQTGADLYIEVTCSTTHIFVNGCVNTDSLVKAF